MWGHHNSVALYDFGDVTNAMLWCHFKLKNMTKSKFNTTNVAFCYGIIFVCTCSVVGDNAIFASVMNSCLLCSLTILANAPDIIFGCA